jgi:hypothetical protein
MGDLIDLELYRSQRDQEAQELAELEQMAREEGITLRELVKRLALHVVPIQPDHQREESDANDHRE